MPDGFSHASSTALSVLDSVQVRFLRVLGVTEESALIDHSLAPLSIRRDIAILGLIHRSVIGQGPPMFARVFRLSPPSSSAPLRSSRSRSSPLYSRQFRDPCNASAPDYVLRSPLGGVRLYNILPEAIARQPIVHAFTTLRCFVPGSTQATTSGKVCYRGASRSLSTLSWRIARGRRRKQGFFLPPSLPSPLLVRCF